MTHDEYDENMAQDDLLKKIYSMELRYANEKPRREALRAVVELANQPLDTENMPAQEVAWYSYGYNLALTKMLDAIAKELF